MLPLCYIDGTELRTCERTDGQIDGRSDYLMAMTDLSVWGIKLSDLVPFLDSETHFYGLSHPLCRIWIRPWTEAFVSCPLCDLHSISKHLLFGSAPGPRRSSAVPRMTFILYQTFVVWIRHWTEAFVSCPLCDLHSISNICCLDPPLDRGVRQLSPCDLHSISKHLLFGSAPGPRRSSAVPVWPSFYIKHLLFGSAPGPRRSSAVPVWPSVYIKHLLFGSAPGPMCSSAVPCVAVILYQTFVVWIRHWTEAFVSCPLYDLHSISNICCLDPPLDRGVRQLPPVWPSFYIKHLLSGSAPGPRGSSAVPCVTFILYQTFVVWIRHWTEAFVSCPLSDRHSISNICCLDPPLDRGVRQLPPVWPSFYIKHLLSGSAPGPMCSSAVPCVTFSFYIKHLLFGSATGPRRSSVVPWVTVILYQTFVVWIRPWTEAFVSCPLFDLHSISNICCLDPPLDRCVRQLSLVWPFHSISNICCLDPPLDRGVRQLSPEWPSFYIKHLLFGSATGPRGSSAVPCMTFSFYIKHLLFGSATGPRRSSVVPWVTFILYQTFVVWIRHWTEAFVSWPLCYLQSLSNICCLDPPLDRGVRQLSPVWPSFYIKHLLFGSAPGPRRSSAVPWVTFILYQTSVVWIRPWTEAFVSCPLSDIHSISNICCSDPPLDRGVRQLSPEWHSFYIKHLLFGSAPGPRRSSAVPCMTFILYQTFVVWIRPWTEAFVSCPLCDLHSISNICCSDPPLDRGVRKLSPEWPSFYIKHLLFGSAPGPRRSSAVPCMTFILYQTFVAH